MLNLEQVLKSSNHPCSIMFSTHIGVLKLSSKSYSFVTDERFHKDRNRSYISKWLRKSIRLYGNFEESMDSLKSFFKEVKVLQLRHTLVYNCICRILTL